MNTDERIALYIAGALPDADVASLEEQLDAGWPEGEAELARLSTVIAELADTPPLDPPPELRTTILNRVRATTISGMSFVFANEREFVSSPHFPGISIKLLNRDVVNQRFSLLMKLAPGARIPAHHHDGVEECLVLEGEIWVGNVRMGVGDYQRANAHTDHVEQWSETGATVWLSGPLSLLSA